MNRNKSLKIKLHAQDPRCHWCKRETKLTNISRISGHAEPLMATIDHLISRYNPERWECKETKKVLACYECNFKRAIEETAKRPKDELDKRAQGYSLNPRKKRKLIVSHDFDGLNELCGRNIDIIIPCFGTVSISYHGPLIQTGHDLYQFVADIGQPAIIFSSKDVKSIETDVKIIRLGNHIDKR